MNEETPYFTVEESLDGIGVYEERETQQETVKVWNLDLNELVGENVALNGVTSGKHRKGHDKEQTAGIFLI